MVDGGKNRLVKWTWTSSVSLVVSSKRIVGGRF